MIKRFFLTIIFILMPPGPVFAGNSVLAVQSLPVKPYEQAIAGFEAATGISPHRIILSKENDVDIYRLAMRTRPDLILAVGMGALEKTARINNSPIIYLMVLNPLPASAGRENITGVSMQIAPGVQMGVFEKISDPIKRIGLIYNPLNTGAFVDEALRLAEKSPLELVPVAVGEAREVSAALKRLKGRIDAFWMLPDISVVTWETVEMLLLFSLENSIPVFTFSEKYVEMGALLSMEMEPMEMGKQAGEMANRIISGGGIKTVTPEYGRTPVITVNEKIAKKLKIRINPEILDKPL